MAERSSCPPVPLLLQRGSRSRALLAQRRSMQRRQLIRSGDPYSCVVNWRPYVLGSEMQLCGFRIFYEPPSTAVYLPLVSKGS